MKFFTLLLAMITLVACSTAKGIDNITVEVDLCTQNCGIIEAGIDHGLLLTESGKLYGTGHNSTGQLGLGDDDSRYTLTQVDTAHIDGKVISIAAADHSLLLTDSGKLYGTGLNRSGQLGLGDTKIRYTFTQLDTAHIDGKIISIAATYHYSLLLTDSGKLYATGSNEIGGLGLGEEEGSYTFTQVDIAHIDGKPTLIFAGNHHSLLLTDSGKLYGTGYNRFGQLGLGDWRDRNTFTLIDTAHIDKIASIAAIGTYSLLLTDSGKLYATGDNEIGQLGLGDWRNRNTFTQVDTAHIDGKIISIMAGLLLTNSGKLYGTGDSEDGRLGFKRHRNIFTLIDTAHIDGKVVSISRGSLSSLLLTDSGKLYGTGGNYVGQLGLGDDKNRSTFTQVTVPVESTIDVAEDVPAQASAEPVIDIDPKYLITSQNVGVFPSGRYSIKGEDLAVYVDGKKTPTDGYKITTKTETVVHPDNGAFEVDVYVVSENDEDLLILDSYSIEIISDKFKTSKNIGLGSTIDEFVAAYPDFKLRFEIGEYDGSISCWFETEQLSNVRHSNIHFILDENDIIRKEKLTFEHYRANKGQLDPSDFKKDTKIKNIFILE
ncbi:MAG: hypothetical protein LBV04_03100 [Deferribacteraceae bacterium]|nr:hypothetical protein [Deferribacteraceae bacterium]